MKYRTIPNTDLSVSETGFGTWTLVSNWWGNVSEEDSVKLIHKALDLGINLFDTADQYSSGLNEEVVAKALKGQRNDVVLCTKVGYDFYTFHRPHPTQGETAELRAPVHQRRLRKEPSTSSDRLDRRLPAPQPPYKCH